MLSGSSLLGVALLSVAASALPRLQEKPLKVFSGADDVVQIPWIKKATYPPLAISSWHGVVKSTGRNYTGHVAVTENAALLSIELPPNGCVNHLPTSNSSKLFNCEVATNGGYFEFPPKPACQYDLITRGNIVQWDPNNHVGIGLSSTTKSTTIGYLAEPTGYNFTSFLSGAGWLLRQGATYVTKSREFPNPSDPFITEKAPRTGVGVTQTGAVMLLVVDGIETENEGVDLFEFAEIMADKGAYNAINLDGGGSSDMTYKGKIYSRPTCQDTPEPICERDVTSITCIAYSS